MGKIPPLELVHITQGVIMATCNCIHRKGDRCIFPKCVGGSTKGRRRSFDGTNQTRGWRDIGGVKRFYRSNWEANFARVLEWHKRQQRPFQGMYIKEWLHEPEKFWFDREQAVKTNAWYKERGIKKTYRGIRGGTNAALIDFKATGYPAGKSETGDLFYNEELDRSECETHKWFEVKGYFAPKDLTKKKRMGQYYPWIDLEFIDKQWFQMNRIYQSLCPGWEVK